jgi:hypothetical protein
MCFISLGADGFLFCFSARKHGGGEASMTDMIFFLVGKQRVSRSLNGRWILRV